jgi:hypothetical protein
MTELYGGTLGLDDFAGSMAEEIEKALDEVRQERGYTALPKPPTADKNDLDDRRMFFVAIARGVIRHLAKHQEAFEITVTVSPHPSVTTHPTIKVKEL